MMDGVSHLVEILFVSDFKSIKPRLESKVLLRSHTYCLAVKVHWARWTLEILNIPVIINIKKK